MTSSGPSPSPPSTCEAFDTNVVVRLLVQDDEDQCRRAEHAWRGAVARGGAWLATVVLVELGWVLRVAYRFDRETIAGALRRLVGSEGVFVEDPAAIRWALDAFASGPADFADLVILHAAQLANAMPLHTFDGRLAEVPGAQLIPP